MRRLFPSLHGYEGSWLRGDLIAGLTVWAVLIRRRSRTLLLYRASRPHVASLGQQRGRGPFVDLRRHPGYAPPDGIAVLRIEGGLFFANADAIRARVRAEAAGKRAVVLDAETVPGVDVTAAEMLANLHAAGVELLIAGDIGRVRDVLDRSGDVSLPAYPDVESALAALERGDHR